MPKTYLSIIKVQIVSLRTYLANRSQEVNVNVDKYNPPCKLVCWVSCTRNEVKVAKLSFQICWRVNIDTKNACRKCTRLKSSVLKKSWDDLRTFFKKGIHNCKLHYSLLPNKILVRHSTFNGVRTHMMSKSTSKCHSTMTTMPSECYYVLVKAKTVIFPTCHHHTPNTACSSNSNSFSQNYPFCFTKDTQQSCTFGSLMGYGTMLLWQ